MDDLLTTRSPLSVDDAVAYLRASLTAKGVEVFAVIDHARAARAVGLELAPEIVVVFGNPAVGTSLMQDQPDVGYDLPLRLLIRQDGEHTIVAYRDPTLLASDYGLTTSRPVVEKLAGLLKTLAAELAAPAAGGSV